MSHAKSVVASCLTEEFVYSVSFYKTETNQPQKQLIVVIKYPHKLNNHRQRKHSQFFFLLWRLLQNWTQLRYVIYKQARSIKQSNYIYLRLELELRSINMKASSPLKKLAEVIRFKMKTSSSLTSLPYFTSSVELINILLPLGFSGTQPESKGGFLP